MYVPEAAPARALPSALPQPPHPFACGDGGTGTSTAARSNNLRAPGAGRPRPEAETSVGWKTKLHGADKKAHALHGAFSSAPFPEGGGEPGTPPPKAPRQQISGPGQVPPRPPSLRGGGRAGSSRPPARLNPARARAPPAAPAPCAGALRPPARRGAGRGPGRQDAERAASGLPRAQLPAAGGCGRPRQGRGLAAGVAVGCRGLPRHRGPAGAAGDRRWGRARGPGPVRGGGLSPAARPGPSRRSRGGLPAGSRLRLGQGCLWALPCKGSGPPATAEGTRRLWQGPRARSWSAALKNSSHFSF